MKIPSPRNMGVLSATKNANATNHWIIRRFEKLIDSKMFAAFAMYAILRSDAISRSAINPIEANGARRSMPFQPIIVCVIPIMRPMFCPMISNRSHRLFNVSRFHAYIL